MINAITVFSFGQIILNSQISGNEKSKIKVKDPEEDQIVEGFEGECEQCEEEKFVKPCQICEG